MRISLYYNACDIALTITNAGDLIGLADGAPPTMRAGQLVLLWLQVHQVLLNLIILWQP